MLQFRCPLCQEILDLPESIGGQAGLCPHCHGRVRVPAPTPKHKPTAEPPPANRHRQAEERIVAEEPPLPMHHEDDRPRRRRDRPKRRRRISDPGTKSDRTGMIVGGIIAGVVLLGSCAAALALPPVALAVVGTGGLLAFGGGVWFLFVAFNDDVVQGLLCLFIPFYHIYYLINNFEEEKVPFFLQIAGILIALLGGCAGAVGLTLESAADAFGP